MFTHPVDRLSKEHFYKSTASFFQLVRFPTDLHDMTCPLQLTFWRMKRSVNATISAHEFQATFKMLGYIQFAARSIYR